MTTSGDSRKKVETSSSRLPGIGIAYVPIEKNFASLGFFTPSSKRIRTQKVKTVTFTKNVDGNSIQARVTIVPGAIYGLPTTADQDKYFALQKIVSDCKRRYVQVSNPIGFSSAELLALLRQSRRSGKNYELVNEWLNVMATTTIISEGMVYLAGRKSWAKDRFRVFDRAVSFGSEMADGRRADKNYVWFSAWQLENINNNHLMPVDLESYLRLKNPIAKALVPHLQIWLHASRHAGQFEKRYDELCQVLNLRPYSTQSKIREKLGPSLNELAETGYLSGWRVEPTIDRTRHKVVFRHGERFSRKTAAVKTRRQLGEERAHSEKDHQLDIGLVAEVVKRGISECWARKLLFSTAKGQPVLDQLEWGDYLVRQNTSSRILNPTGFYIYLIRENVQPPESFESSRKKALFEEAEKERERQIEKQTAFEIAYDDYRNKEVDKFISENYSEQEYRVLIETKRRELLPRYREIAYWNPETLKNFLDCAVKADLENQISLRNFDQFVYAEEHAKG